MRKTRLWLSLLAAGTLAVAGCGTDSDDDAGGSGNVEEPTETPIDDGEESDDAADAAPGDGENPGLEVPQDAPDENVFENRAAEVVDAWPDDPQPVQDTGNDLLSIQDVPGVEPGDTELTAHLGHGDCDVEWGSWVRESDDLVVLGGWSVPDPGVEVCNNMVAIDPVEVELEKPLGDRELVDAVTGEDLRETP